MIFLSAVSSVGKIHPTQIFLSQPPSFSLTRFSIQKFDLVFLRVNIRIGLKMENIQTYLESLDSTRLDLTRLQPSHQRVSSKPELDKVIGIISKRVPVSPVQYHVCNSWL